MRYLIAARDRLIEILPSGYNIYVKVEIRVYDGCKDEWVYEVCIQKGDDCQFFSGDTMDKAVDAAIERYSN